MKSAKRLTGWLFYVAAFSALLFASCAVPFAAHQLSPWWLLDDVGPDIPHSFFVAVRSATVQEYDIEVMEFLRADRETRDARYGIPEGRLAYSSGPGEGDATVYAGAASGGGQLIRVFVAGDTPWTSLSEYRVIGNRVYSLRHGHSAAWLLIGCPVLVAQTIRRGTGTRLEHFFRLR
jgi:hypothetical protein